MKPAPGSVAEAIASRAPLSLRQVQGELIKAVWCIINGIDVDRSIDLNVLLNIMHYLELLHDE